MIKLKNDLLKYFSSKEPIVKSKYTFDMLMLSFGVICYFYGYHGITLYALVHLVLRVLQIISKTFANKLIAFREDQETIKSHYLEDFKFCYYFVMIVKTITGCSYGYFFFLSPESLKPYGFVLITIMCIFVLTNFIDLGILIYIILYKNNSVKEVAFCICYHCISRSIYALGSLHMVSNIPMISPNVVTNSYHLWSPIGRGYGAQSSMQLFQVDLIKTELGSNFDYTQCIDQNKFLDQQKLSTYAEKNNVNLNQKVALFHNFFCKQAKIKSYP